MSRKTFRPTKNSLNCEIPDFFASNSFQKKQSYQLKKNILQSSEKKLEGRLIERSLKKQAYYQQGKCDPSLKKSKKIPDLAPEKIFWLHV